MVWSTTQSALYNDLSRYYEDGGRPRKTVENFDPLKNGYDKTAGEELPEKCPESRNNECHGNRGDKFPQGCDNNTKKHCSEKNPPVCPNCPRIRQAPNDQISRLISEKFSDRDMLLIAGLIFLLMKQGADRKLILALAFVLLS